MLFKYTWVDDQNRRGYKTDEFGFSMVNFTHSIHGGEEIVDKPYVLASQATQVFYIEDKRHKDCACRYWPPLWRGWYVRVLWEHSYNVTSYDAGRENLRWGRDDVERITIEASIIGEGDLHEVDNVDDCEFIDDESNDEDDNKVEYSMMSSVIGYCCCMCNYVIENYWNCK